MVQKTNDDASTSKLSSVTQQYYSDDFIHVFVGGTSADRIIERRPLRRNPIINRFYALRAVAIRRIILEFLLLCRSSAMSQTNHNNNSRRRNRCCQIVSLGAGFDSCYYNIESVVVAEPSSLYAEVDFPDVVARKKSLAAAAGLVANPSSYRLIGGDLRDLPQLLSLLQSVGDVDVTLPTLFVSEVVLAYMPARYSTAVIEWSCRHFSAPSFCIYEQINPTNDAFAQRMNKHFTTRSSPLLSLGLFPTLDHQRERFRSAGYNSICAVTLEKVYDHYLSREEIDRIEKAELFDEWNEWLLTCHHYFILLASKVTASSPLGDPAGTIFAFVKREEDARKRNGSSSPDGDCSSYYGEPLNIKWEERSRNTRDGIDASDGDEGDDVKGRWGHSAVLVPAKKQLLVFGGRDGARTNSIVIHKLDKGSTGLFEMKDGTMPSRRDFHTGTLLGNDYLLVIGGRQNPKKACTDSLWMKKDDDEWIDLTSEEFSKETCRWKHTANVVDRRGGDGCERVIVIGGKNGDDAAISLQSVLIIDVNTISGMVSVSRKETKSALNFFPPARFSHTTTKVTIEAKEKLFIYGGLDAKNSTLADAWLLDCESLEWTCLSSIAGTNANNCFNWVVGRSGHSCVYLPERESVLIVGGVAGGEILPPSQKFICFHLISQKLRRVCVDFSGIGARLMLVFHVVLVCNSDDKSTRCIVAGGGTTTFSFGEYRNQLFTFFTITS